MWIPILFIWLLLGPVRLFGQSKSFPLEVIDNDLFVKAYVNGKGPFNFVVDTGASGIGRVDARIVEQLDLVASDSTRNYDGSGNYQVVPVYRVNELTVGGITAEFAVLPSRNYNVRPGTRKILTDGIIGRDFFKDYLLIIDCRNSQILYSKDSLTRDTPGVIEYDKPFQIRARLGKFPVLLHIDTGSNLTLHLPQELAQALDHSDTPNRTIARKANSEYTIQETILHTPLHVSSVQAEELKVHYSPQATYVNVGMGFLKDYKLTIDQRHQLLKIE